MGQQGRGPEAFADFEAELREQTCTICLCTAPRLRRSAGRRWGRPDPTGRSGPGCANAIDHQHVVWSGHVLPGTVPEARPSCQSTKAWISLKVNSRFRPLTALVMSRVMRQREKGGHSLPSVLVQEDGERAPFCPAFAVRRRTYRRSVRGSHLFGLVTEAGRQEIVAQAGDGLGASILPEFGGAPDLEAVGPWRSCLTARLCERCRERPCAPGSVGRRGTRWAEPPANPGRRRRSQTYADPLAGVVEEPFGSALVRRSSSFLPSGRRAASAGGA